MSEVLIRTPEHGASTEVPTSASAPEAQNAGRFEHLRELGNSTRSLVDLTAGIALAEHRINGMREFVSAIDGRYDGLPGRRTRGETVSMQLEADVILTFRLQAQRAGHTDTDAMPADLRSHTAEAAARAHSAEIIDELQAQHPDMTTEQLIAAAEVRIADLVTILAMKAGEREEYNQAVFAYQERKAQIPQLIAERTEMGQEYRQRVRAIGRIALAGLVSLAGVVKQAPAIIGSHVTAAFTTTASRARTWYGEKTAEQKRTIIFSAASVAIAGIATYWAMRYGGVESHGPSMKPVSFTGPDHGPHTTNNAGDLIGGAPNGGDVVGGQPGGDIIGGNTTGGDVIGGTTGGDVIGNSGSGDLIGAHTSGGDVIGGNTGGGDVIGGSTGGDVIGGAPSGGDVIGGMPTGEDLSWATTSKELFKGNTPVSTWPDTITVSHWNAKNHDGSLWGISETMWHRSGVAHPTPDQINQVVDALRPQAQPNGFLLNGQQLDLRPALGILPKVA